MSFHRRNSRTGREKRCEGMSLVEVLIAMLVLTIGIVGLLGTLAYAMAATQASGQDMIAKQLASEAMENVFTARNADQLVWLQIQNQGAGTTPDGIFLTGFQPINQAPTVGVNAGLINTPQYLAGAPKVLTSPGPDGTMGTADDLQVPLSNFRRSISIVPMPGTGDQLRSITITVQYATAPLNVVKTYTLQGFISQFR